MSTIAIAQPRRPVLADVVPRTIIADVALVLGAAALVGALAQISIPLGFTPVPITGQTLGVMLAGTALGWRRGALAMALYVVAGIAGVPWFAHHAHGYVGGNFGYLVGFVLAGGVLGWLASRGSDRTLVRAFIAMALGDVIIFAVGVPWLAHVYHLSASVALTKGFWPFVGGELIKAGLAGVALPTTWRLVDRMKRADG